jgi:cyclic-di-GMP-binding protein
MKNSFFLVIPAQEASPERQKEFEPKALGQWLEDLPTANPGLATRLIQDFIADFNALQMPLQLRLDALEQMRPKVLIIEEYLRSRLIKAGFPKEENDLKILNVLTTIEREFTIGYWIVLKELTYRQVSWFQGKNLALSLQRCIKGLGGIVVSHFLMGLSIPDWVWIDLHSLYKLSIKLKKDAVKVSDDTNSANKVSSPEECYRQILLLNLSQPTGLMQKEVFLVYQFIETLFPYFSLSPEPIFGQQMQFVIMTDEDKPPFIQIDTSTRKDTAALFINFTKLYKVLEKKDKFINPTQTRFSSMHLLNNQEEKPTAELLDYLELRWSGIELQKEAVFSDRLDRYIAIGMGPAHQLQSPDLAKIRNIGNPESNHEILVHTESDRLLFAVFKSTGVLLVGNLISFRKANQPEQKRSLGVINELIVAKQSGKISFGMQMVATLYHAVYYSMVDTADTVSYKGLFHSIDDQYDEASFLVVDNFVLKEGDIIKMLVSQEDIHLILKDKKNIALGYWQFKCQRIAAKVDKVQPKKGYDFI